METTIKLLIALCCILFVFLGSLSIFLLKYQPSPRSRLVKPNGSAGSSSRSRMAARWANMEQGSRRSRNDSHIDDEEIDNDQWVPNAKPNVNQYDLQPDDLGSFGKLDRAHRSRSQASLPSSLVGTGPNGTRTLLMGWFGLDEPISAGYNTRPESKEKNIDGEALPMRATNGADLEDAYQHNPVVPHHRLPTTEDHDWEAHSETSGV